MSFSDSHYDADTHCKFNNHQLGAINANLETLVYALSHDLRAPLLAIDGYTRVLAEDMGTTISNSVAHSLSEIQSGIGRMQRMIDKWLSFARAGSYCLNREPVDLSQLARSVVAELTAAGMHHQVEVQIADGLHVDGDAVLLRELLQNLISNALKFTQHNQHPASVEFACCKRGDATVYFVRDNGIGFGATDASRIFQPFVSLHDPGSFSGTGLGLAIVSRIIAAHGGNVWAEGEARKGATFYFTLPARSPDSMHSQVGCFHDGSSHNR